MPSAGWAFVPWPALFFGATLSAQHCFALRISHAGEA
jgi:hypothetical protein